MSSVCILSGRQSVVLSKNFYTVAIMRLSQSTYSQSENISSLSVNLVLNATSGRTTQEIVGQITAHSQAGDTATGKQVNSSL